MKLVLFNESRSARNINELKKLLYLHIYRISFHTNDKDGVGLLCLRGQTDSHRLNGKGLGQGHLPPMLLGRPRAEGAGVGVGVHGQAGVVAPQGGRLVDRTAGG